MQISHIGRVMVPVADADEAIEFYTKTLGFSLVVDVPFGDGDRWVEVSAPGGGCNIALVPPQGDYQAGKNVGIAIESADVHADHAELKAEGVDIDEQVIGGEGGVPPLFFFRDNNANTLMIVTNPRA